MLWDSWWVGCVKSPGWPDGGVGWNEKMEPLPLAAGLGEGKGWQAAAKVGMGEKGGPKPEAWIMTLHRLLGLTFSHSAAGSTRWSRLHRGCLDMVGDTSTNRLAQHPAACPLSCYQQTDHESLACLPIGKSDTMPCHEGINGNSRKVGTWRKDDQENKTLVTDPTDQRSHLFPFKPLLFFSSLFCCL